MPKIHWDCADVLVVVFFFIISLVALTMVMSTLPGLRSGDVPLWLVVIQFIFIFIFCACLYLTCQLARHAEYLSAVSFAIVVAVGALIYAPVPESCEACESSDGLSPLLTIGLMMAYFAFLYFICKPPKKGWGRGYMCSTPGVEAAGKAWNDALPACVGGAGVTPASGESN